MTDEQLRTCPVCRFGPVEASWHSHRKDVDCRACGKFVNTNMQAGIPLLAGRCYPMNWDISSV